MVYKSVILAGLSDYYSHQNHPYGERIYCRKYITTMNLQFQASLRRIKHQWYPFTKQKHHLNVFVGIFKLI